MKEKMRKWYVTEKMESQILQENIRWKALDEIYNIYMFLHRSDLNISENFRQTFSHFWQHFKVTF